jgi:hypothetical protein
MEQILFAMTLSFLLVHEMDAVRAKEWNMFVFLKDMKEDTAYRVFTGIHLLIYLCAFYALMYGGTAAYAAKLVVDIFLLGHAFLHIAFRKHSKNGFQNFFSKIAIYSASALALAHLILLLI